MIPMTGTALAAACGGKLYGTCPAITGVVTDSRKAGPGDLFVALHGQRADGHDFVPQVLAQGAACALVERLPDPLPEKGALLLVPDTSLAIQRLAGAYRAGFSIPLVGITGSVGKTTQKEMCAAVLSQRFLTHKTEGNFNNNLGVPLTLFGLEKSHQAAVIEMGISHFGEMTELSRAARPNIVLMTNIGDSHLEFLGDRAGVLRAKSEIFQFAAQDGAAVLNGDDALLHSLQPPMARRIFFGLGAHNDFRAENVRMESGSQVDCDIIGPDLCFHVCIPGFGEHLVYAALGAAAVGWLLGLRAAQIAAGIAAFLPTGRRARVVENAKLTVIDDCYNANPNSVQAALSSLAKLPGRRVAILGDMLELGPRTALLHRGIGQRARELGLDRLLCIGPLSKNTSQAAGDIANWYPDKASLLAALPAQIQAGDKILVKASRGMALETVVEALLAL